MAGAPKRFASGFEFVEGPAFDSEETLHVVNVKGGYISKVSPRGKVTQFVNTNGAPNGAKFDAHGHLYVCDCKLQAILDIAPDGLFSKVVTESDGKPLKGPNDLVFDMEGGYYFTDPEGSNMENPIGTVHRVDPGGNVSTFAQGLAYPNGIVVSEDQRRVFIAETFTRYIHSYALRPDGMAAASRVHGELPKGGLGPDGMALDVEGNLYVAYYDAGTIVVLDPWGNVKEELDAGGKRPTNVAFGGKDRTKLFITETETDSIYVHKVKVPGLPLYGQA